MTHTKFKGPGQWRSQAAELELDNDEASEVASEDEHESARPGSSEGSGEETE